MFQFASAKQACTCLNLSINTIRKYRLDGTWIEGIHWVQFNSRCIRYNLELLQDWVHNQNDPIAHQRAIDRYQAQLLSNQPGKRTAHH